MKNKPMIDLEKREKKRCLACEHFHEEPNWCMAFEDTCECPEEIFDKRKLKVRYD